ncbi:hypothetical protein C1G80_15775 [Salmonella enterica subsp. enterica serovar Kentucky]|nr:hypothetical protein C1D15_22395 [Salmonella enterica subsp. enterica serovar Kentucky]PMS00214.1 hypothetical protein C1G81_19075 [Salmonella enterica subsp. enterica serovar Kentucky]PNB92280.1 hypothetical protein C1G80_15775 [Salmonella enterica subsp. enterica serovar Kentucky]
MGSCAAPSAKGDDKFITTDYLQQCRTGVSNRKVFYSFRDSGPGCALAFAVSDSSSGPTQQKIQYCRAKTRNIIQSRKHKPNGYAQ